MNIEDVNTNGVFRGLQVPQGNTGGLGNQIPGPRLDPQSLFDALVAYLEGAKAFIKRAAKYDGGWEKWLQAAMSQAL